MGSSLASPAPSRTAHTSAPTRRADIVFVALASLAFATSSPLARLAGALPPVAVASGRTALAACLLILPHPGRTLRIYRGLTPRARVGLLGAGACLGAHFALFLGGLATTSFAATVALISLEPLAVVLASWLAFSLVPRRAEWVGIALATAGAFVVSRGAGAGEHTLRGDLMVVGSVALYGAYVAAARGLRDTMPATQYAAAVYGVASLALFPFVVTSLDRVVAPSATTWTALVLLALIPTLVGHTLVQVAARTAPPTLVALTSPGETIGSLAIGAVLLHKAPTEIEGAGAAVILLGAFVAIYGTARRAPVAP